MVKEITKVSVFVEEPESDTELRLILEQCGNTVVLKAVRRSGTPVVGGKLLQIGSGGTFTRISGVSRDLGLVTDGEDRILIR